MDMFETFHGLPVWAAVLLAITAALVLLALVNYSIALLAERRRPPTGRFIEVNGASLHYTDQGAGRAVVLLHGNGVSGDDYKTSGVAERLVGAYRVIIFDRPGFGHTPRPRGQLWRAAEQADLIHAAFVKLDIRDAIIVGHSWGTLVALALADRYPANVTGSCAAVWLLFPHCAPRQSPGHAADHACPRRYPPLYVCAAVRLAHDARGEARDLAPSPVTERFKREFSTAWRSGHGRSARAPWTALLWSRTQAG